MLYHFNFVLLSFPFRDCCFFCSWRQKERKPTRNRQSLVCSIEIDEAHFTILTVSVHSSCINKLKRPLTLNNGVKNAFFNYIEYKPTLFLRGCIYSVCIQSHFYPHIPLLPVLVNSFKQGFFLLNLHSNGCQGNLWK